MPPPRSRGLEIGLLLALCVFLPLYEAPKNLAWLAYALVWLANRVRARDFGGRWDLWDTLILAWLAAGFVIAPFAALHGSEWRAPLDIVRNAGVLWMVKRSRLAESEARAVLAALVVSVLVGLAMGYAQLWRGTTGRLELNSVGHVNHTAIYLAIMLGLCASWLFIGRQRTVAGAATLLLLVSLFVAASRSGVVAGLLTLAILALAWWPRSRVPAALAAAVLVASGLLGLLRGAEVFEKHTESVQAGHALNYREQAWSLALSTWQRHPWFGVGMDNFALASRELQSQLLRDLIPHAHNLYLNTLAERGVVGAAPLAAVLIAWGWWLFRRRPRLADAEQDWVLWGAAATAWVVTVVVGMVNTTLHHEHGLLAALLLGLWLPRSVRR
ncbi:MAG: O-antigen ligase family protein [Betaproteobacteria bacterium]|nr:MAG: O-antigen ligase family protein [Betaproteobacteria bacterium]